jgi:hypothetical protein
MVCVLGLQAILCGTRWLQLQQSQFPNAAPILCIAAPRLAAAAGRSIFDRVHVGPIGGGAGRNLRRADRPAGAAGADCAVITALDVHVAVLADLASGSRSLEALG